MNSLIVAEQNKLNFFINNKKMITDNCFDMYKKNLMMY